jgi:hypothetical protein
MRTAYEHEHFCDNLSYRSTNREGRQRRNHRSTHLGRRTTLGLLAPAWLHLFIRPAQQAWPEQTTIPDILKGSGEVRIAASAAPHEAQQKHMRAEKLGHQGLRLPGPM